MSLAIEVDQLTKMYGNLVALDGLSFEVRDGEVFGLIGPNGAGKTTTLRILSSLIKPASGSAEVFGFDVVEKASEVREMISYLPQEAGAYKNLSDMEYLQFMAGFYSEDRRRRDTMVSDGAVITGLQNRLGDRIKEYSAGMKRRLLLARSLMMEPKLAILDEPTSGLDVVHAYHVRRIILDYARQKKVTVLLSSHNMLEVEFLCERVILIHEGRVLAEGIPADLKVEHGADNLEEVFMEATADVG